MIGGINKLLLILWFPEFPGFFNRLCTPCSPINSTRPSFLMSLSPIFFRFSVGIDFNMVYGAMLTKTNRISRIFQSASQSARRPSYISPRSQLIITAVLVSVQFMAAMVWIVASIPDAEKDFPTRSEVSLLHWCVINQRVLWGLSE